MAGTDIWPYRYEGEEIGEEWSVDVTTASGRPKNIPSMAIKSRVLLSHMYFFSPKVSLSPSLSRHIEEERGRDDRSS